MTTDTGPDPGVRPDGHEPTLTQKMGIREGLNRSVATGRNTPRYDKLGRLLCAAKRRGTDELCRAPAMAGLRVCRLHGGASKQAQRKARLRLAELIDPAIGTLAREMVQADKSADKQRAANSILDRAGLGRVSKVETDDAKELLYERLTSLSHTPEHTPEDLAAAPEDDEDLIDYPDRGHTEQDQAPREDDQA